MYWIAKNRWAGTKLGLWANMIPLAGLLVFATSDLASAADPLPTLSYPAEAFQNHDEGVVIVQVKYGLDGKVESCRIIRSNAPFALESSTVDFIRKNWKNAFFAGDIQTLPIVYTTPSSGAAYWDGDMVPPPNLLSVGEQERNLKLRLSFGSDGWVKDIQIIAPSGSDALDHQTAIWVKVHWHHAAYANQVVDAPFKFEPPPPPPAPKPPQQQAPPPPPSEPVAIPAIRAE